MMTDFVDMLFGCWHSNYSFPLTARSANRSQAAQTTGTYVVCLDCGKEFAYDWKSMKVVSGRAAKAKTLEFPEVSPALAHKQAA